MPANLLQVVLHPLLPGKPFQGQALLSFVFVDAGQQATRHQPRCLGVARKDPVHQLHAVRPVPGQEDALQCRPILLYLRAHSCRFVKYSRETLALYIPKTSPKPPRPRVHVASKQARPSLPRSRKIDSTETRNPRPLAKITHNQGQSGPPVPPRTTAMHPAFRNRFKRPKRRLGGREIAISRPETVEISFHLSRPDLEIIRPPGPARSRTRATTPHGRTRTRATTPHGRTRTRATTPHGRTRTRATTSHGRTRTRATTPKTKMSLPGLEPASPARLTALSTARPRRLMLMPPLFGHIKPPAQGVPSCIRVNPRAHIPGRA